MRVRSHTFDPDADAAYCYLNDGPIETTDEIAPGIIVDWNARRQPVGVEVLYVSQRSAGSDLPSFLKGMVEGLFATRQAAE